MSAYTDIMNLLFELKAFENRGTPTSNYEVCQIAARKALGKKAARQKFNEAHRLHILRSPANSATRPESR